VRPAGRLDGAYWLIGPGSVGLAQGCRCALPLLAWAGHVVAAARLQLVYIRSLDKDLE